MSKEFLTIEKFQGLNHIRSRTADHGQEQEKWFSEQELVAQGPSIAPLNIEKIGTFYQEHRSIREPTLQRLNFLYGNCYVQRLVVHLSGSANSPLRFPAMLQAAPSLQRYEAGEHAQFGAKPGEREEMININGVTMTYGEMSAMGDLFEKPQDVRKAGKEELEKLISLIRRERAYLQGKPGVQSVKENEWEEATGGRYLKLAAQNVEHFASAEGQKGHRETWRTYHKEALRLARKNQLREALQVNAFADHFLADAFCAGHLISRIKASKQAEFNFDKIKNPELFSHNVANVIFANPNAVQRLSNYEINVGAIFKKWKPANVDSLSKLMELIRKHRSEYFYSNFVKMVHDQLNREIKSAERGIRVRNKKGDEWQLSGDKTLSSSQASLKIIQSAVAESRQNIHIALGKEKVDYNELIKKVEDYIPEPTEEGTKRIQDVLTSLTDPLQQAVVDAFAGVILTDLEMVIQKLTKENRLRGKKQP